MSGRLWEWAMQLVTYAYIYESIYGPGTTSSIMFIIVEHNYFLGCELFILNWETVPGSGKDKRFLMDVFHEARWELQQYLEEQETKTLS
jgi:hypothetical protein